MQGAEDEQKTRQENAYLFRLSPALVILVFQAMSDVMLLGRTELSSLSFFEGTLAISILAEFHNQGLSEC